MSPQAVGGEQDVIVLGDDDDGDAIDDGDALDDEEGELAAEYLEDEGQPDRASDAAADVDLDELEAGADFGGFAR